VVLMTEPTRPRQGTRKRRSVVSSSVAAAATVGVTGLTMAWAVGSTPPSGAAASAAQVSSQIAADKSAMAEIRQSIAVTKGQLAALGIVVPTASANPGDPAAPGTPATPGVTVPGGANGAIAGKNGSVVVPAGGAAAGSVAARTPGAAAVSSSSGSPAPSSNSASGGAPAPAPVATSPAPGPTAPPATSPPATAPPVTSPPATTPPPPVTTTTGASAAQP